MIQLGISIYPEKTTKEENFLYISKAAQLGFSRLFISLLEIKGDKSDISTKFKQIITHARELNYEVILDINPSIFHELDISYSDLSYFHELGASGLRLDLGFSGVEEAAMTHNPYNLSIEINMSHGTAYLDNIMSRKPRSGFLIGSHNFYPHKFTGLELDFFTRCSTNFKKYGIRTAAFITSQNAQHGPWPWQEGLCTLEDHRYLPIEIQATHLAFSNVIDCIIIGNAYATDEELLKVSEVIKERSLPLKIEYYDEPSMIEKEILLESTHIYRGEINSYVYRTKSDGRKKYKNVSVPPHNNQKIRKGDILIDNDLYQQYKAEVQIAKRDLPCDEKVNVIGKIAPHYHYLLDSIQPWSSFHFTE